MMKLRTAAAKFLGLDDWHLAVVDGLYVWRRLRADRSFEIRPLHDTQVVGGEMRRELLRIHALGAIDIDDGEFFETYGRLDWFRRAERLGLIKVEHGPAQSAGMSFGVTKLGRGVLGVAPVYATFFDRLAKSAGQLAANFALRLNT